MIKQQEVCKWYCCCPIREFTEEGRLDRHWIEEYCHGCWERCIRYQKEENGSYHPDNMLPDGRIDKSLL
jgi:hypothetical protein